MRLTLYLLGREIVTLDVGRQPQETPDEYVALGGSFERDEPEPWTDRNIYEQENEAKRRVGFV